MKLESTKLSLKDFLTGDQGNIYEKASAFQSYISGIIADSHFHYKRVAESGSGPIRQVRDIYTGQTREMLYLASNDYLNLTNHPEVIRAGADALYKYGAGAGSVPLLGGSLDIHEELAEKVAHFKGCEAAILYTSGFGANHGALSALLGKDDLAVLDMLCHASILDGCSHVQRRFFLHNDMVSLEKILIAEQDKHRSILIAVDGVYSMDGDIAPLDKIYELAKKYGAFIYVDEAHASGVIGENGKGTPSHFGLEGKIDFVAGTFSKCLGGVGGFVATTKEIVNMLTFVSRNYMFSTAMTPQVAGSMLKSIEVVQNDHARRNRLWENINFFKEGLSNMGFKVDNNTAIFPLILRDDFLVKEATRMLQELGIYVNPVLYPAVPSKASRIRMSLMSEFTFDQLNDILNKLEHVSKKLNLSPAKSYV